MWKAYDDTPGYPEAVEKDDLDAMWKSIDDYIIDELGFLPDYEVN